MKKVQLNAGKLQLNKMKVSNLIPNEMAIVRGGGDDGSDVIIDDGDTDFHMFSIGCSRDKSCTRLARNGTCCWTGGLADVDSVAGPIA